MSDDRVLDALLTRRTMIAGGLLGAAAVVANSRRPDEPFRMLQRGKLDALFPKTVGDWEYKTDSGLVLPPEDELRDRLYSRVLTRYYAAPNQMPIMFLVAYSSEQDGMLQVHRPEICYPAAGYEVMQQRFIPLDVGGGLTIPGHYLNARSTSRQEQLIYWTRIGNDFPTRWWAQHWAVAKENLKGRVPDGVLVRISTSAPDDKTAMTALTRFIPKMLEQLSPTARRVLFGEAGAPLPGK
ncbi:exosortase-associated protein EpsI, V-type [Sphingomonas sp. SRS2]|uniref:exosortase-associated protein EpsI, V-type n=1 Tax=Sphingomonas sp. SRS2 TaxID=133190 RepID=UPI00061845C9|nr:exosortase-associated protein EpsI, V-type [Sphingomonas sp. SRS2]KKC25151.1 methanolan biosynthesis protein EpsI [Sphingomonas sp. SRS2]